MYFSLAGSSSWLVAFTMATSRSGAMFLATFVILMLVWSLKALITFRIVVGAISAAAALMKDLRASFASSKTRSYQWRVWQLKALLKLATDHEAEIIDALTSDLSKPEFESVLYEVSMEFSRISSAREINKGDEIAWYADGDYTVRNEFNSNIAYGFG